MLIRRCNVRMSLYGNNIYLIDLPNGARYYSTVSFESPTSNQLKILFFKWDINFWAYVKTQNICRVSQLEIYRYIYLFLNEVENKKTIAKMM